MNTTLVLLDDTCAVLRVCERSNVLEVLAATCTAAKLLFDRFCCLLCNNVSHGRLLWEVLDV
jgi:hypothetical protein